MKFLHSVRKPVFFTVVNASQENTVETGLASRTENSSLFNQFQKLIPKVY